MKSYYNELYQPPTHFHSSAADVLYWCTCVHTLYGIRRDEMTSCLQLSAHRLWTAAYLLITCETGPWAGDEEQSKLVAGGRATVATLQPTPTQFKFLGHV